MEHPCGDRLGDGVAHLVGHERVHGYVDRTSSFPRALVEVRGQGSGHPRRSRDGRVAGPDLRHPDAFSGCTSVSETAAVLFGLAISIGIASARERAQPSRWLRLLESPAIVPLGVTIATISLVLGTDQWELFRLHRGDWDDIPRFAAWASIGAVVAYASMLLRRRRREALS